MRRLRAVLPPPSTMMNPGACGRQGQMSQWLGLSQSLTRISVARNIVLHMNACFV